MRVVFDEVQEANRSLILGVVARWLHRGVIVPTVAHAAGRTAIAPSALTWSGSR